MSGTKESELVIALLLYAMRSVVEGDLVALRHMNFGPHEMAALRTLSLSDLYRVQALRSHCLDIRLNRTVFNAMIKRLQQQCESEVIQHTLIAEDAPLEMMATLFGMSSREYSRLRRSMTLAPAVGRPSELEDDESHALWHAYQAVAAGEATCLAAETYLQLSQQTGIALRSLWSQLQRWSEQGSVGSGHSVRP